MKKLLRLSLVCLMALACGTTFAQNVVLDFTENVWGLPVGSSEKMTEAKDFSNGTYTIRLESSGSNGYYFNTDGYLMLGKTKATLTLPKFDFAVGKIEVVGRDGASASVEQNIFVGDVAVSTETKGAKETNSYAIAEDYQTVGTVYTLKVLSSHNTQITKINIYSVSSLSKKDAGLKFSTDEISVALNETFTEPTLTKETNANVTYSSSNEEVATVDATTGKVTIVATGTTNITASTEENDEYNAGSASYTLTVTPPVLTEVTIPYTESFKDGIGSFTINDVELGEGLDYVWSHDDNYGYMKASAYNKKNIASESWLVSPTINLENATDAKMSFDQTINKYFGTIENEATLWIQIDGENWQQVIITYPSLPTSGNWSDTETQTIDLTQYLGKKIKVGFKYVSTDEAAGTWEIENFSITGTTTGIDNITVEQEFDENAPVYNLQGQRVSKDTKGILIQNGKKFINR